MSIARNTVAVSRTVNTALWIAKQEQQRLMERIKSTNATANERFQALVELASFSRQIVIMLTETAREMPTD